LSQAVSEGRQILTLPEASKFLDAYGIPFVKTTVASTLDEAVSFGAKLGFPVAMKVLSRQITHKSQANGVILNVCSQEKLKETFCKFAEKPEFEGVIIQPMVPDEFELIVGSKKDPQFGSVIIFGKGGVKTEQHQSISIGLPPLNQILARRLIENKRNGLGELVESSGLLKATLEETLVKLSQLIVDFPEIKEVDINPLIVHDEEVTAVDVRVAIDTKVLNREVGRHEHLVIAPYPSKYVAKWKLRNDTPVLLRPIKPEDEERFKKLFLSLSPQTMHFRFFQIIKDIPHETMTRYCNIDYDREMAIVAELGDKNIIGATRLIVEPNRKQAEFAILVGDEWQGLGLGDKFMDYLLRIARDMNLRVVYGLVIYDNCKMLKLMEKYGFTVEKFDDETYKVYRTIN